MKKILIVVALLGIVAASFGVAGFVYANGQTPPSPDMPYESRLMDDYDGHDFEMMSNVYGMMDPNMMGYGMMGMHGEEGPMHEVMIESVAEELNVPVEEINARHEAGETIWEIAESEGLSEGEIQKLMSKVHDGSLKAAIENGWMTQEQAEHMGEHMNEMWDGEFESHCSGESMHSPGERWQGMDR